MAKSIMFRSSGLTTQGAAYYLCICFVYCAHLHQRRLFSSIRRLANEWPTRHETWMEESALSAMCEEFSAKTGDETGDETGVLEYALETRLDKLETGDETGDQTRLAVFRVEPVR
ncbi:hypothetical protein G6O67_005390 [Ophiocordyceps sinensis]|uniref:Uncharacterized protein n=1 Tax=Ophiocordyceps sinensis TaxID=72228 RepID=A0A8H4V5U8_9HYPO|nr:hypothetical protein G6O67_005390 [Ophiocordyceps sinensis]